MFAPSLYTGTTTEYRTAVSGASGAGGCMVSRGLATALAAAGDNECPEPAPQPDVLPDPVADVVQRQGGVQQLRRDVAVGYVGLAALADVGEARDLEGLPEHLGPQRPFVRADTLTGI